MLQRQEDACQAEGVGELLADLTVDLLGVPELHVDGLKIFAPLELLLQLVLGNLDLYQEDGRGHGMRAGVGGDVAEVGDGRDLRILHDLLAELAGESAEWQVADRHRAEMPVDASGIHLVTHTAGNLVGPAPERKPPLLHDGELAVHQGDHDSTVGGLAVRSEADGELAGVPIRELDVELHVGEELLRVIVDLTETHNLDLAFRGITELLDRLQVQELKLLVDALKELFTIRHNSPFSTSVEKDRCCIDPIGRLCNRLGSDRMTIF